MGSINLFWTTAVLMFVAELPDKTMISSVILAKTFSRGRTFVGAILALATQTVISVTAGRLLALLNPTVVRIISASAFYLLAGIVLYRVWKHVEEAPTTIEALRRRLSTSSQVLVTFVIIFLAEFGDITQFATADLAARYRAPVIVGLGAITGLIGAITVAMTASRLLDRVSEERLEVVAGVGLLIAGTATLLL